MATTDIEQIASVDRELAGVRVRNVRKQKQRQQQLSVFRRRARHSAYLFFILLFAAAGAADLYSFVKDAIETIPYIGWIIGIASSIFTSICIGVPMYFAQKRVKKMNEETARIADANQLLRGDLDREFKRLRPAMVASGQDSVIQKTDPATIGRSLDFVSYKARIILNILIVQLLEAIPILDLGPWQIVKVTQVFIHQQREFRQARNQILGYQMLDRRLGLLEGFERDYLEAILSGLISELTAAEQEQYIGIPQRQISGQLTDVVPVA